MVVLALTFFYTFYNFSGISTDEAVAFWFFNHCRATIKLVRVTLCKWFHIAVLTLLTTLNFLSATALENDNDNKQEMPINTLGNLGEFLLVLVLKTNPHYVSLVNYLTWHEHLTLKSDGGSIAKSHYSLSVFRRSHMEFNLGKRLKKAQREFGFNEPAMLGSNIPLICKIGSQKLNFTWWLLCSSVIFGKATLGSSCRSNTDSEALNHLIMKTQRILHLVLKCIRITWWEVKLIS